jgi:alpha-ketoglutarate-dependent taurine dioxygenase
MATPLDRFKQVRRQALELDPEALVRASTLDERRLPLVLEPALPGVDLVAWARANRPRLQRALLEHGGVLVRGTDPNPEHFRRLVAAVTDKVMDFSGGAATRTKVGDKLYTSTEYPAHLPIHLHNEHCYANDWPMLVFFFCTVAPDDRGETPIVSSRALRAALPEELRRRFEEKGVLYVRNYRHRRAWQSAYHTEDRAEVEAVCRRAQREFEWIGEHELRTWERRPAVRPHPITGEPVWFNFAHGFHVSRRRDFEVAGAPAEDKADDVLWPNNAFYGDGTEIDEADLDTIERKIAELEVAFPWRAGDLLILDNMLVAHGRRPFSGPRKIMLQMAHRHSELGAGQEAYLDLQPELAGAT